jgi:hypothetical protein
MRVSIRVARRGKSPNDNRRKGDALKSYKPPTLVEWGTVSDLTQGLGHTNQTDGYVCVNEGGQTFDGSSSGHCTPI